MSNVIATHAVGNMDTWLAGGAERTAIFSKFCKSYRIYRDPRQPKVSIVFEDVDMPKLEATLASPETVARGEAHGHPAHRDRGRGRERAMSERASTIDRMCCTAAASSE